MTILNGMNKNIKNIYIFFPNKSSLNLDQNNLAQDFYIILIVYRRFQIKMQANGINYYKGVLLCSRPNESPSVNAKKQFCGRVYPHEQLGMVPVKQFDERKTKKRVLPVLNNHKKWLQNFKKEVHEQKEQEEKEKQKAAQRLEKIKQEGYQERERTKNPPEPQTQQNQSKQHTTAATPSQPHRKKEKPAWAKTAQQVEQSAEKEVDQLIDFFNTEQKTELKDYVSDDQVRNLLVDLKSKIEKLKQQEDWKGAQLRKIEQDKPKQEKQEDKDDVLSRISKQSGAQSVASQKTVQRVEQLQRKKKEVEWDKHTTSEKKSKVSVDEQIAKNIADQVLRNYPALKHHSNQSVRQLIEKHAHQQIKS